MLPAASAYRTGRGHDRPLPEPSATMKYPHGIRLTSPAAAQARRKRSRPSLSSVRVSKP